jgi:hypothetical protein
MGSCWFIGFSSTPFFLKTSINNAMKKKLIQIQKKQFEDNYSLNMFEFSFDSLRKEFGNKIMIFNKFDKFIIVCNENLKDDVLLYLCESSSIDFEYNHRFATSIDVGILLRENYSQIFN